MIRTNMMMHQKLIVDFSEDKDYVGIFADYGTGKTLCALVLINKHGWKKILIVSTQLAIDSTWCDEIRKHTDFKFCVLRGTSKQKAYMLRYALGKIEYPDRYTRYNEPHKPILFMVNFGGVKGIYQELQRAGFEAIFVDESTKIKTFDAKRTMAIQQIGDVIPHRYIMTGFPITENFTELYAQIKFLDRGKAFGTSYYAFLNRYFVRQGMKSVIKKKSVKQILELIAPFCIRVTNEHLNLPPKIYKKIGLELTDQQRELLDRFNETFRLELGKVKIDTKYIFTLISKSLQICDGFIQQIEKDEHTNKVISQNLEVVDTNKDEALIETLEEIDIHQNKVVIWCGFLFSVNKIERYLKKLGIPSITISGSSKGDPNRLVNVFQRSKDVNVLVATPQKASESITLTAARYAIYYSNIWSNEARLNSEARIRRKGSERHSSIMYIDLVTKCKVEENMYKCLRVTKKNIIEELKAAFLDMKEAANGE